MSFAKQVKLGIKEQTGRVDLIWRLSVAEAFNRTVLSTPVDTGAARASWLGGFSNDGSVGAELKLYNRADIPPYGSEYMLYSNLPYIEVLEDGSSTQAPNGMVKTVVPQWAGIVKKYE